MRLANRLVSLVIAFGVIAGCSSGGETNDGQLQSFETIGPDISGRRATFEQLTQAAEASFDHIGQEPFEFYEDAGVLSFDVIDCTDSHFRELREIGENATAIEDFAQRFVVLRMRLVRAGYSQEVIDEVLDSYANRQLAILDGEPVQELEEFGEFEWDLHGDSLRRLAGSEYDLLALMLDQRRRVFQPDMPHIVADGGCGAFEHVYEVRPEPRRGRIWLITSFSFNLCRVMEVDPWNLEDCNRWAEVSPDVPAYLSGRYVYQARWLDGRSGRGVRVLENWVEYPSSESDASVMVVTIRPD